MRGMGEGRSFVLAINFDTKNIVFLLKLILRKLCAQLSLKKRLCTYLQG